jgi:hypothetical protein
MGLFIYFISTHASCFKECSGNATHDVKQCREKYPDSRVPNHYAFLSVDHRLQEREYFMECNGMLAVYIPCNVQMEDHRSLRLLKDGVPSVLGVMQMLVCEII